MPTAQQRKTVKMVREIADYLRKDGWEWPGLRPDGSTRVTRVGANLFLLGCVLDGQQKVGRAWWQAQRFLMSIVPWDRRETLWNWIAEAHTKKEWARSKGMYGLHYLQAWHDDVYTYAHRIVDLFDGDPRAMWQHPPDGVERISHVRSALQILGLGPARTRMCVGALRDHGIVHGATPFKDDIHVSRLMYRLGLANSSESADVLEAGRRFFGPNSWEVDWVLFRLGQDGYGSRSRLTRYYEKHVQHGGTPLAAAECKGVVRKFTHLTAQAAEESLARSPNGNWRADVRVEKDDIGFYLWSTKAPLSAEQAGDRSWIWLAASVRGTGEVDLNSEIAANTSGRLTRNLATRDALYAAGYTCNFDGSSTEYFWKALAAYPPARAGSVNSTRVIALLVQGAEEAMKCLERSR